MLGRRESRLHLGLQSHLHGRAIPFPEPGRVIGQGQKAKETALGIRLGDEAKPLTNLFDPLLVLDEQLNPGDVDVQPRALGRTLHRRVKATIILTAKEKKMTIGTGGRLYPPCIEMLTSKT